MFDWARHSVPRHCSVFCAVFCAVCSAVITVVSALVKPECNSFGRAKHIAKRYSDITPFIGTHTVSAPNRAAYWDAFISFVEAMA